MLNIIMPPERQYKRARSRKTFFRLFIPKSGCPLIQQPSDLPPDPDERHWWTVIDLDPNGQHLYLLPGFRFANRLGFVETERAWGGDADEHPPYVY
mgnify:CR=1 FL=1